MITMTGLLRTTVTRHGTLSILCALLLLAPVAATADVSSGLVAHYRLDGNALDASGHGNHGTLIGTTPTADRFGNGSSALRFDGVADQVEIPDSADFDFNQPVTVAAWIFLIDGAPGGIVGQWGAGGLAGDAYLLAISDARLAALFSEPPVVVVTDPIPIATGTWRFVAMTYDGVTVKLFKDGTPAMSGLVAAAPVDSDQPVRLGLEHVSSSNPHYLHGAIDDVRIYNRALTDSDVYELYLTLFQDGFESGDASAWSAQSPP